jgi:hypothetical protein
MELLQRTNDRFREGVRVRVVRAEALATVWVRIEGWPKITKTLNMEMCEQPMAYWTKIKNLKPGMLVAVYVNFETINFWDRAILLRATATGYNVFLIDWGIETHQAFNTIRLLPRKFAKMPPWARKVQLAGVRDQSEQGPIHRLAQMTILRQSGTLWDIDRSPGEAMTARLMLDNEEEDLPLDIGPYWLKLGYVDRE